MRCWGGRDEASVLVAGDRLPMPSAAFANAVLIHALDLDDVYIPASLHVTSIIVPTMLTAAETGNVSGCDALAAMVMGIEVAGRLGIAGSTRRPRRGFPCRVCWVEGSAR